MVVGVSRKCSSFGSRVSGGPRSLSFTSPPPTTCPQSSLEGPSPEESPPLHLEKLHAFSTYGGSETRHTSLGASPWSGCGYRGVGIWHVLPCWLPSLTSQYPVPEGGQPLMLFNMPPCLHWGPGHVDPHSLPGSGNGIQSGSWAAKFLQWLLPDPLLAWRYLTSAMSTLPRKCRFPNQGTPSALAHMVGALVISFVGKPHYRSLGPPPWWSWIPPSGWLEFSPWLLP